MESPICAHMTRIQAVGAVIVSSIKNPSSTHVVFVLFILILSVGTDSVRSAPPELYSTDAPRDVPCSAERSGGESRAQASKRRVHQPGSPEGTHRRTDAGSKQPRERAFAGVCAALIATKPARTPRAPSAPSAVGGCALTSQRAGSSFCESIAIGIVRLSPTVATDGDVRRTA